MSTQARGALRAAIVVIAPAIMFGALISHPYLPGRQPNLEALAAAVKADPTRWGIVHLATGVGSALLVLAFLAIRSHLHEAGEDRWSSAALPFVVVGSTLYAMLPAMEFAPLAAMETGRDVEAAQRATLPWFIPILVTAGITFAVGMFAFAVGVSRSGVLSPGLTRIVVAALIILALSRLVPLSAVQFYLQAVAGYVALLPLAFSMWMHPATPVPTERRTVQPT